MAETRVEYRFVLDAYTPETIPQALLAAYLADLAELYGEAKAVHFVRLEESSLAVVSAVDFECDDEVGERLQSADTDTAPADVKKAYQSIKRRVTQDGGTAYVTKGRARVLEFPQSEAVPAAVTYGPFWQAGHLSGTVILLGGKSDPVSVRLQDNNGEVQNCKASRAIAKRLREFLFEQAIRVVGRGKWRREPTGRWRREQFDIDDFATLDEEPLALTVARLRAIDGDWKHRPDPLGELDEIRRGN